MNIKWPTKPVNDWMLQLVNAVCVCDVLFCLSFSGFVGHLMFVNFNLFLSFCSEIFYLFWFFYCNDFSYYCQHIYGLMIYRIDFFLFIYFEWKSFFPGGQWQIFFVSSDLNSIDWLPWNQYNTIDYSLTFVFSVFCIICESKVLSSASF